VSPSDSSRSPATADGEARRDCTCGVVSHKLYDVSGSCRVSCCAAPENKIQDTLKKEVQIRAEARASESAESPGRVRSERTVARGGYAALRYRTRRLKLVGLDSLTTLATHETGARQSRERDTI
jgi:hypothetical protein